MFDESFGVPKGTTKYLAKEILSFVKEVSTGLGYTNVAEFMDNPGSKTGKAVVALLIKSKNKENTHEEEEALQLALEENPVEALQLLTTFSFTLGYQGSDNLRVSTYQLYVETMIKMLTLNKNRPIVTIGFFHDENAIVVWHFDPSKRTSDTSDYSSKDGEIVFDGRLNVTLLDPRCALKSLQLDETAEAYKSATGSQYPRPLKSFDMILGLDFSVEKDDEIPKWGASEQFDAAKDLTLVATYDANILNNIIDSYLNTTISSAAEFRVYQDRSSFYAIPASCPALKTMSRSIAHIQGVLTTFDDGFKNTVRSIMNEEAKKQAALVED